jgi:hypothetical protein
LVDQQTLTETTTTIQHYRSEQDRLTEIDRALENEIAQAQVRLRQRRYDLHAVMADVVTQSDEYLALLEHLNAAWIRLRSLRIACSQIQSLLAGYLPHEFETRWQAVEPLEDRVGYDVDENLIQSWTQAMHQLATDADTPLPSDDKL